VPLSSTSEKTRVRATHNHAPAGSPPLRYEVVDLTAVAWSPLGPRHSAVAGLVQRGACRDWKLGRPPGPQHLTVLPIAPQGRWYRLGTTFLEQWPRPTAGRSERVYGASRPATNPASPQGGQEDRTPAERLENVLDDASPGSSQPFLVPSRFAREPSQTGMAPIRVAGCDSWDEPLPRHPCRNNGERGNVMGS
jgi:hypothetical protein